MQPQSEELRKHIAKNLHTLLVQADYSQNDLAVKVKLTDSAVSQILSCQRTPQLETLLNICDHFNVSLDWFLGRKK